MVAIPHCLDDHAGAVCHADRGLKPQQELEIADWDVRVRRAEHADYPHQALLPPLRHCEGSCRAGVRDGPCFEVPDVCGPDGVAMQSGPQALFRVGTPDQRGGVGPPRLLRSAGVTDGVQQDCQRPGVRRHVVGLGRRLLLVYVGQEGLLTSGAMPDGPLAIG